LVYLFTLFDLTTISGKPEPEYALRRVN